MKKTLSAGLLAASPFLFSNSAYPLAVDPDTQRWPYNEVPYKIDTNHATTNQHRQEARDLYCTAIDAWQKAVPGLKFIDMHEDDDMRCPAASITTPTLGANVKTVLLQVNTGNTNEVKFSPSGSVNTMDATTVNVGLEFVNFYHELGSEAPSTSTPGLVHNYGVIKYATAVHELGHLLGFQHEHQRADRGQHVQLIHSNVNQPFCYWLLICPSMNAISKVNHYLSDTYDIMSAMHYMPNAMGKKNSDPEFAIAETDHKKVARPWYYQLETLRVKNVSIYDAYVNHSQCAIGDGLYLTKEECFRKIAHLRYSLHQNYLSPGDISGARKYLASGISDMAITSLVGDHCDATENANGQCSPHHQIELTATIKNKGPFDANGVKLMFAFSKPILDNVNLGTISAVTPAGMSCAPETDVACSSSSTTCRSLSISKRIDYCELNPSSGLCEQEQFLACQMASMNVNREENVSITLNAPDGTNRTYQAEVFTSSQDDIAKNNTHNIGGSVTVGGT